MRNASNAFIFVSLVVICTYIFKKLLQMFPQSRILICVVSVAAQIKWVWDCLLLQSLCQFPNKFNVVTGIISPENGASEVGVRVFEGESDGAVECAVCLCKIEEGEEVRDLKCGWALVASLARSAELTSSQLLSFSEKIIIKRLSSWISALIVEIDAHGG
nr:E3 ubiquitin-protein ligase RHA2B-like [Ipomoea batatas]GMD21099.1 E3 ubiquitin-protein ligase RHA2B-like [Ipomoea batatas]